MINVEIREVDVKAFNDAVNNIIATSKKDMKTVVDQQAKLLAIQCMHYTPPFAGGVLPSAGADGSTKADQKAGVEAVKRDIFRTMTPPSELFRSGYTSKFLEKIVKKRDMKRVQDYLDNVKSPKLNKYKVAQFDPQLHQSKRIRGNRYRPEPQHKLVLDERFVQRYVKEMQKRVGYMKAGWAVAVQKFGGNAPAWIKRLLGDASGTAEVLTDEPASYSVEMSNYSKTIGRFSSNYNVAVRIRTNAMVRAFNDYLTKNIQKNLKSPL